MDEFAVLVEIVYEEVGGELIFKFIGGALDFKHLNWLLRLRTWYRIAQEALGRLFHIEVSEKVAS